MKTGQVTVCLAVALLTGPPAARTQPVPPDRVFPLAVHAGRCEFELPTDGADDKYCLVVGSASARPGPFSVSVRTEAGETSRPLSLAEAPRETPIRQVPPGAESGLLDEYAPSAAPPGRRTFSLFVKDNDFQDPDGYQTVTADLRAVGRHCQVYVDREQDDRAELREAVADVVRTFDDEVHPRARGTLGRVLDVDRDGRFTILFTGWLGRLAGGRVALGGFVRGSDFFRDLPAPYGNRCDMMFLNADLRAGPHLRTLVAHEYTHAVVLSEHVFGRHQPGAEPRDEEGWLNEGLAHLVEDLHGYGWSNLDYRVSAFLNAPQRYQLVVPDYYSAGLWRSHGHRGATYLFLRWCLDQYGADLPARLTRTNRTGVSNLEAATGARFADLFRRWTVAVALNGTKSAVDGSHPLTGAGLHQPLGGHFLCGPRFRPLPLHGASQEVRLAGTSAAFFLLYSPPGGGARVRVTAAEDAELQVTLVRLPRPAARLQLRVERLDQSRQTVRLSLRAHDAPVTLAGAAWEALAPPTNRGDVVHPPVRSEALDLCQHCFGPPEVAQGEERMSGAVSLPVPRGPGEAWVFKLSAEEPGGRRLSAWVVLRHRAGEWSVSDD